MLLDRMSRGSAWSAVLFVSGSALVACATYEGLPMQADNLGDAGAPSSGGSSSDGGNSAAGTGSVTTSAGKTSVAGNASGGSVQVMEAGAGGTESGGGKGGVAGAGGSSGGESGSGGTGGSGGKAGSGGTGGSGGTAGKGGSGGTAGKGGSGGSGGSGPAACSSKSPDASCSCVANAGHDYWFCATFLTFAAAEAKCTAAGMHLPKVETQAEDDFIFNTCATKTMGEYFLGGTDASTQDTWVWVAGGQFWKGVADGTPTGYTNWSVNEPNASGDCLVVQSNSVWDDRTCTDQRKYVCEAPP